MKIKAEVDLDDFWDRFEETYTYEISNELRIALKKDALKQLMASPEYKAAVKKIQDNLIKTLVKEAK